MDTSTVTMFAPDGSTGEIPQDKVQAAQQAGFKRAYNMTDPNGKGGYIPEDRVPDAEKAGFKRAPAAYDKVSDPYRKRYDTSLGGILGGAGEEVINMAKGVKSMFAPPENIAQGALGPALPAYRMAKGYVQSAGTGLQQAWDYARTGQPVRAAATVVGAVNPLSSGPTASINAKVDQGAPISQVIGQGLTDVGTIAVPEAVKVAAPVVSRMAGSTAKALYGTALKPSTTLTAAERASALKTGLENALPVSSAGVEKLGDLIDDFNQKIAGEIATDPNRPIDPNAVATRTGQTAQTFSNQVVAQPDLAAIESQRQQFLAERGAQPGRPAIPPQPTGLLDAQGRPIMTQGTPATPPQPAPSMAASDAQAMKQGTYSVLRKKYGEQGSATVEAQKALARGLKEEIATQFPEINDLNAAESKLLEFGPILERAVNRVSNNHTIGIGGPIMTGGLKAATGSSGLAATAGLMKSIFDIPAVKSRVAIALSKGAKIPYPTALARVSAYQASLGSAVPDSQAYSSDGTPNQPAQ